MLRLDQNIVVVALPKIVDSLGDSQLYAWVISAYLMTSSATMALYGRFSGELPRAPISSAAAWLLPVQMSMAVA